MKVLEIRNWKLEIEPAYAWSLITVLVGAFVALFFSFQAGLFVLLFAVTAWWTWQNPELGFMLLIILMPLLPMLKITQTIATASLIKDVIIMTLFLRTFALPLLTKRLSYKRNILIAPVVALAIWSAISMLRADDFILGVLRLRDIVLYIFLYVAVLHLRHDEERMKKRLWWLLASFAAVLFLAVWQWLFAQDSAVLRFDPIREVWIPRLSSILAHPSIFGEYVVAISSLFLALALTLRRIHTKIVWGLMFTLTLPFIILTYSRAVWIGLGATLAVMFLFYLIRLAHSKISKTRITSLMSAVVATAIIALMLAVRFTPAGGLFRSIVDPTYGSNEERLTFFVRLVAPTTYAEAVIGRGLGDVLEQNFRQVNLQVYDIAAGASRAVQLTKNTTLVDNQYLKTFVEMGVIGLVFYGWIYWRLARAGIKLALNSSTLPITNYRLPVTLGLFQLGFLAAFLIQAFFIDIWDIFPTNALFWIVAALTSQVVRDK